MAEGTIGSASRIGLIRRAGMVALAGNALLAGAKIAVGILAGSMAVTGDGIDSTTDVAIALMTLVVSGIISRPADHDHPWGHGRAETMGTTALAFLLFFAAGQLVLGAATGLLQGQSAEVPGMAALGVTLVSMAGKSLLALGQYRWGKKAGSAMLKANGLNMRNDIIMSTGVLAGLVLAQITGIGALDRIFAILVGVWVGKSAIGLFREVNLELMDGSADTAGYREVFQAALSVPGVLRPHRARMRRIASHWDIDLDIEVDGSLTVYEAHALSTRVEDAIKERLGDVFDIMVHVEPSGQGQDHPEGFGLSPSQLPREP